MSLSPHYLSPTDHTDPRLDARRRAMQLYYQLWSPKMIAEEFGVPKSTVYSWIKRGGWDTAPVMQRIDGAFEARLQALIALPVKDNGVKAEIDFLTKQLERVARINKFIGTGNQVDLNPKLKNRNDAPRKDPSDFSDEDLVKLRECFMDNLFDYQRKWYEAKQQYRIRNLLKSRQIGATYYFAREHALDAFETGDNQIFLSASKAQAHVFRSYINAYVREATGKELRGEVIRLANGAELYFLGTNTRTAQGYHGHVMMDEYFWIHGFTEFRKVASGMAMHKKWRQTYSSTPSAITHEAYAFWSAAQHEAKLGKLDISQAHLRDGVLCHDKQWRQIVNIEDAVAGGCNLFDLDQLRLEYSESEFANLLMCQFMDDSTSEFPFSMLSPCMLDAWEEWTDFKPYASRPLGNEPVSIGYDPSKGGDGAGITVTGLPSKKNNKFRLLERVSLNIPADEQVLYIKHKLMSRYNVVDIGMDITGCGAAAHELVKQFFPQVRTYTYNPQVKFLLVSKAQEVFKARRIEFDLGDKELVSAFTSVKRTLTPSGRQVTFDAQRRGTAHGDLAWALMHTFGFESLGSTQSNQLVVPSESY